MEELDNKVAMITGAGGAVGSYVTNALLKAGCKAALVYRSERHEKPLSDLQREYGNQVLLIQADLAEESGATSAVEKSVEAFGHVDYLVNPVGGWLGGKRLHEHSTDDLQHMLNIDLIPTFNILQAILPQMMEQGNGRIINFGSMAVFGNQQSNAVYAASKAAVVNMTDAVAREYTDDGIQSFVLAPSTIDSEANRQAMPNADHSSWVTLEDIAEAVMYLCRSGSAVSGTVFKLRGRIA